MSTSPGTASFLLEQLAPLGDASLRRMFGEPREGHLYPGAKPHLLITADQWEDREWLCQLVTATARTLPVGKIKKKPKPQA